MENLQQSAVDSETQANENLQNVDVPSSEILQNESEQDAKSTSETLNYSAENAELEAFLSDSTTTKAEAAEQSKEVDKSSGFMPQKKAAEFAVLGVIKVVEFASEQTGKKLMISQTQLGLMSTLFVPVIMKHGNAVMRYIESMAEGVDENSYMPEYLAIGGAGALGGSLWWQHRKVIKAEKKAKAA